MLTAEQINELSIDELSELNKKVVSRLNLLQGRKQEDAALNFSVNDEVYFDSRNGDRVEGVVVKVNKKTVRVSTDVGLYKVSPTLLKKK